MMRMDMISRKDFYEKLSLPRKAVVTITINPVQLDIIKYEIVFDKSFAFTRNQFLETAFKAGFSTLHKLYCHT